MTVTRRPLRILMVSAHYPPVLNGYAIQCADTSDMLARRGHDVLVLTGQARAATSPQGARCAAVFGNAQPEGRVNLRPGALASLVRRRALYRRNARRAASEAAVFRPDVALVWQFDSVGIGVALALQTRQIPVAYNVEDYSLATVVRLLAGRPSPARAVRRWMYGVEPARLDLSCLMLVSGELRALYAADGFANDAMTVVHNGLPSSQLAPTPPAPGPGTRLLYVGRLHPTKGVSLAIEAVAHANHRCNEALTLDVIGTGEADYVARLEALARSEGLSASVRFLGHCDRDAIFALYDQYDALLFPSTWVEPFGLAVIEAMARGVPVIALEQGGPKEIITHMTDGLLVPVASPEAFGDAIACLAGNAPLRHELGAAAIRKVERCFTVERQADRTEAVLQDMVDRHRADRGQGRRA